MAHEFDDDYEPSADDVLAAFQAFQAFQALGQAAQTAAESISQLLAPAIQAAVDAIGVAMKAADATEQAITTSALRRLCLDAGTDGASATRFNAEGGIVGPSAN